MTDTGQIVLAAITTLVSVFLGTFSAVEYQHYRNEKNEKRSAQASRSLIRAELQDALNWVRDALKMHRTRMQKLEEAEATMAVDDGTGTNTFKSGVLQERAKEVIDKGEPGDLDIAIQLFAFRRAAWDLAIAKGDLKHLSPELESFSRAYAKMNEVQSLLRSPLISGEVARRAWVLDAYVRGDTQDVMLFARSVREVRMIYAATVGNLYSLQKALDDAISKVPTPVGAGSAAPPSAP